MSGRIIDLASLHRENLKIAWAFAHRMTPVQFEELCRLTMAQFREADDDEVRGHA